MNPLDSLWALGEGQAPTSHPEPCSVAHVEQILLRASPVSTLTPTFPHLVLRGS